MSIDVNVRSNRISLEEAYEPVPTSEKPDQNKRKNCEIGNKVQFQDIEIHGKIAKLRMGHNMTTRRNL